MTGPEGDPTAAICARTESPKRCGSAGWLHRLRDDEQSEWRAVRRVVIAPKAEANREAIDFEALAARFVDALQPDALERLAESLGLTPESFRRLAVGWSTRHGAYSFPMRDAAGRALGIRLRRPDGGKFAVRGGREGLFIPAGLGSGCRLCITEGATDCAALLDLGLSAVGRPNCSGGLRHIVELLRRLRPLEVVIVADADAPGQRGAENLAGIVTAYARAVRVITPPPGVKDARAWRIAGATRRDIEQAIEAAPVRRLRIVTRRIERAV